MRRTFFATLATLGATLAAGCNGDTTSGGPNGDAQAEAASSSSSGASGSSGASSGTGLSSSGAGSSSGSSGAASSSSGGAALQWYWTCGDPVCHAPSGDAGPLTDDAGAACPAVGSACSTAGEGCGTSNPYFNCGATEVCAAEDPTHGPGGCPISSRKYKDGIEYVGSAGLEELHDETLGLKLATYHYKPQAADPSPEHLGFIIEDTRPGSPAVLQSRERVDLYGYMSMLVATMQVQEREIAELRREVAAQSNTCR